MVEKKLKRSDVINLMAKRGFSVYSVNGGTIIFINEKEENSQDVLVEVKPDISYHFIYTCEEMFGFLDSGDFDNITNDYDFERLLNMFVEQIANITPLKTAFKVQEGIEW